MRLVGIWTIWVLLLSVGLEAKDYTTKPEVKQFINQLAKKHHLDRKELKKLFSNITYQRSALAVYVPSLRKKTSTRKSGKKKYKKMGSWDRYEKLFLKSSKAIKGVSYMRRFRRTFRKAYQTYGVQPEYIAAIIGIESHYGANTGKYPVLDTLSTLAFEKNRRQKFFRSELREFLLLTHREKINPRDVKGSYAGAIGLGQFMPSNYAAYVVDFNGDGKKRMLNPLDAIASIAYYLKRHGWKKEIPVATRVSYPGMRYKGRKTGYKHKYSRRSLHGIKPRKYFNYKEKVHLIKLERLKYDELWYGTKNFYAITRYNHNSYYAMAVHQLAERIKKRYTKKYGRYLWAI